MKKHHSHATSDKAGGSAKTLSHQELQHLLGQLYTHSAVQGARAAHHYDVAQKEMASTAAKAREEAKRLDPQIAKLRSQVEPATKGHPLTPAMARAARKYMNLLARKARLRQAARLELAQTRKGK